MKHADPNALAAGATVLHAPRFVGRHRTLDMLTYENLHTFDAQGNHLGQRFERPYRVNDSAAADGSGFRTYDSTGAFIVGELERLDQTMHEPLATVSYLRDVPLREDVTIGDEVSSFTRSTFGSAGGLGTGNGVGNGKAWMGKDSTQISSVSLDLAKIPHPLKPWALELKYTILELESAARIGRPIDQQLYRGLQLKHQMDTDEQVYIGDMPGTPMAQYGLVNNDAVTNVSNVAAGAAGGTAWTTKTPAEILQDVNEALTSAWTAAGYAVMPNVLLLPPTQFGYLSSQLISIAGSQSILSYVQKNNLLSTSGKGQLDIFPLKWLVGAGAGGTIGVADGHDRMIVYSKDYDMVRYPMTLLQRTPVQYDGMYHKTTYYCRLGVLEVVYPETLAYRDGI